MVCTLCPDPSVQQLGTIKVYRSIYISLSRVPTPLNVFSDACFDTWSPAKVQVGPLPMANCLQLTVSF